MLKRVEPFIVISANLIFIIAGIVKADGLILLIALSGLSCYAVLNVYGREA